MVDKRVWRINWIFIGTSLYIIFGTGKLLWRIKRFGGLSSGGLVKIQGIEVQYDSKLPDIATSH